MFGSGRLPGSRRQQGQRAEWRAQWRPDLLGTDGHSLRGHRPGDFCPEALELHAVRLLPPGSSGTRTGLRVIQGPAATPVGHCVGTAIRVDRLEVKGLWPGRRAGSRAREWRARVSRGVLGTGSNRGSACGRGPAAVWQRSLLPLDIRRNFLLSPMRYKCILSGSLGNSGRPDMT